MPLVGDFNFYGGIYRDVHLLVTSDVCISPLDFASSGVYLVQQFVSEEKANIAAKIQLLNGSKAEKHLMLKMKIRAMISGVTLFQACIHMLLFMFMISALIRLKGKKGLTGAM